MKASVTVTLIIVGGILILSPFIADYFHQTNLYWLLQKPGTESVNLKVQVGSAYHWACYVIGSLMILTGISGAWGHGRTS